MASFVEKYGPPVGGGSLMGKTVRRHRDGAVGVVRQQRRNGVMVWVPDQRRNLTFLYGTYEVLDNGHAIAPVGASQNGSTSAGADQ